MYSKNQGKLDIVFLAFSLGQCNAARGEVCMGYLCHGTECMHRVRCTVQCADVNKNDMQVKTITGQYGILVVWNEKFRSKKKI